MATIYCRSTDGNDADSGATWALAKATLAAALTAAGAGGTVYVSDNHAESAASAKTLASPGTVASPVVVYCVDDSAEPPTALATTATVTTTGNNSISFTGCASYYGIEFNCGSGGTSSGTYIFINWATSAAWHKFEKCLLANLTTGGSSQILLGQDGSSVSGIKLELVDTKLRFGDAGQGVNCGANFVWTSSEGTPALHASSSVPTTLFNYNADAVGSGYVCGVDLSQFGSGKSIVTKGNGNSYSWTFANCKMGASVTKVTGTATSRGQGEFTFINSDSGDTHDIYERHTYTGIEVTETTVVRTGGATNGIRGTARKLTASTTATFESPLKSEWVEYWNDSTGSAMDISVRIISEGQILDGDELTDEDVWIEVEYLGTSGYPMASIVNNRKAPLATAANQTDDSGSTWGGSLVSPHKQILTKSVTPQEKGVIRARVCVGTASQIVYYDPLISAGARQFQTVGGFHNEPSSGGGGGGGIRLAGHGGLAS